MGGRDGCMDGVDWVREWRLKGWRRVQWKRSVWENKILFNIIAKEGIIVELMYSNISQNHDCFKVLMFKKVSSSAKSNNTAVV